VKALQQSGKWVISGIPLLFGCLALLAVQPAAARVDLMPSISALVQTRAIIHGTGSHFTPGGSVLVEARNATTGTIIARASSIYPPSPPPCNLKPTCYYLVPSGLAPLLPCICSRTLHSALGPSRCAPLISPRMRIATGCK
jgi:hypothetical protein